MTTLEDERQTRLGSGASKRGVERPKRTSVQSRLNADCTAPC